MSIHRNESIPGYPIYEIQHPTATARVALQGAHVMEWTPAGEQPVLYLSPEAFLRPGKPIRGGVPVCWPWFGSPPESTPPAHGCVRTLPWDLLSSEERADEVMLVFALEENAATLALWPHPFRLEFTLRIGASLDMALRMINTSNVTVPLTSALHTYFAVGEICETTVSGLQGASYMDTVGTLTIRQQAGNIGFAEEVDRIYASSAPVRIHDGKRDRTISITSRGSNTSVVWNPWIAKSKRLNDLPDEDYHRFLCVETANAWQDVIQLPPGASHTLGTNISVAAV
jgi:glucose-6-phosphate 1-epimerase